MQAGAKTPPEAQVDPHQVQDVIIWSSHTFMQDHLPLSNTPAAVQLQQQWQEQQQQAAQASSSGKSDAAQQLHALSPDGDSTSSSGGAGAGLGGFERAESLMDHLAADENMIVADEQQGRGGAEVDARPPRAHSLDYDKALEKVGHTEDGISGQLAHPLCLLASCMRAS